MFELEKLEREFGVALNENDSIPQQEPRQRIVVLRGAYSIGKITSDGYHFTAQELRQKLENLLYEK